ncbi:hypothetical protein ACTXT7_015544 [Hymenolepis weldensis]
MSCKIDVEMIGQFGESYPGYLIGYKGPDTFVFKFIGDAAPNFNSEFDVSPAQIRLPPSGVQHAFKGCDVSVGDYVEVLAGKPQCESVENSLLKPGDLPMSWWPARVIKKGGELIVVEYSEVDAVVTSSNATKPTLDNGLFLNQVRPRSTQNHLSASNFHYSLLEIPSELVELFKEPSYIEHITRTCSPSMLICEVGDNTVLPPSLSNKGNSDAQNVKFLTIFTSDEAKFKAETIFPEVPRMLRLKHTIINQISQITTRIKENTFEKKPDLFYEEFTVDDELLGYSIGAGGANIRRARSVDGIVSVILNPDTCIFTVSGRTQESINNAKRILEYATDTVEVPRKYVSRLVGSTNHQIQALVDRTGLIRIRVQASDGSSKSVFTFTGTRPAINDAKLMINFMLDNLKEIEELEAQIPRNGPNGDFDRRGRRNNSVRSDTYKGDRKSRVLHTEQMTDSGLVTSSTPVGELNGNQTDGTMNHRTKNRQLRNQNYAAGGVIGTNQSASVSRQNSLPPKPASKTNEVSQKQDGEEAATAATSAPAPRQNSRRGRVVKRNQANKNFSQPAAASEPVAVDQAQS